MKKAPKNYTVLLLLAILFACPGIAAYLLYTHPEWRPQETTHQGKILKQAQALPVLKPPHWHLILWTPRIAEDSLAELMQLARVRLALGRRLYQIDLVLLLGEKGGAMPSDFAKRLHDEDINVLRLSEEMRVKQRVLSEGAKIFIADPKGRLILSYKLKSKPGGIFHDIKHLLTVAEANA